ncbi:MAG TPA: MlrC C-terminal domain-containing protein, partial [Conexibacter sp.]|nr:MlrC C-terminal domain-containing protein [Conexibacter sp.]
LEQLLEKIAKELATGYRRIKIKVKPGWDLDAVAAVRARFGAVPVAVVLDLHGNPSPKAIACCDVVVGYRTYPHEDMRACGVEAAALLGRALAGERLVTVLGKLPALTSPVAQATADEPMRGLLERAEARAAAAGVARISLLPGFPYSDVARAGFSVTAVAPAAREPAAREVVAATLADVETQLDAFVTARPDAAAAVERALALDVRPVVLADLADNIGGGGPGDGTALLAELVARRVAGAVVPLVDAPAVAAARAAGVGAELALELGARSDALHGAPVAVRARVVALGDGDYVARGSYMTGQRFSMGATAVLDVDGVLVLAMERATPPFHVEQLTASGIDPAGASLIALKGAVAWRAPYREVARAAVEADTPGCCPADPARLPRTTVPERFAPRRPVP